jgi:hypothetical protein
MLGVEGLCRRLPFGQGVQLLAAAAGSTAPLPARNTRFGGKF